MVRALTRVRMIIGGATDPGPDGLDPGMAGTATPHRPGLGMALGVQMNWHQTSSATWGRLASKESPSSESSEPAAESQLRRTTGAPPLDSLVETVPEVDSQELESLLRRAYDEASKSQERNLRSLDSATTLALGSVSRESLEEPSLEVKGIETEEPLPKTVQEDSKPQQDESSKTAVQKVQQDTAVHKDAQQDTEVHQDTAVHKDVQQDTAVQKDVQQDTAVQKDVQQDTAVQQVQQDTAVQKDVQQDTAVQQVQQDTALQKDVQQDTAVQKVQQDTAVQKVQQDTAVQKVQQDTAVTAETPKPTHGADTAAGGPVVKMVKQEPEPDDSWRRDKYGAALSPAALYARFYRSGRSRFLRMES